MPSVSWKRASRPRLMQALQRLRSPRCGRRQRCTAPAQPCSRLAAICATPSPAAIRRLLSPVWIRKAGDASPGSPGQGVGVLQGEAGQRPASGGDAHLHQRIGHLAAILVQADQVPEGCGLGLPTARYAIPPQIVVDNDASAQGTAMGCGRREGVCGHGGVSGESRGAPSVARRNTGSSWPVAHATWQAGRMPA